MSPRSLGLVLALDDHVDEVKLFNHLLIPRATLAIVTKGDFMGRDIRRVVSVCRAQEIAGILLSVVMSAHVGIRPSVQLGSQEAIG